MKSLRRQIKLIAAFFVINLITQIVVPNVALALTAGPTAPEFSSFEPVDTSDMVNLVTGDFTYNLPLLEVPGPEGGYPINLAYHAGVKPGQESGWVGLGWSLNPGAINRYVNGYADDTYAPQANEVHWDGGETSTFTIGAGYMGIGASITVANDTYKGAGVGVGASVGFGIGGDNSIFGAGVSAGVNPYGGFRAGISAGPGKGLGDSPLAVGGRLGLQFSSTNQGSALSGFASGGISAINDNSNVPDDNASILGASISTSSFKPSFRVAGISVAAANNHVGNTTVNSSSFGMVIPIFATGAYINFGWSNTRYYLHQVEFTKQYGALHAQANPNMDEASFDATVFTNIEASAEDLQEKHVYELQGGAYPAFDTYSVTGQGIGGTMTPYYTNFGRTYRQNIINENEDADLEDIKNIRFSSGVLNENRDFAEKPGFKFLNDFSNSFQWHGESNEVSSLDAFVETASTAVGEEGNNLQALVDNPNLKTLGYDKSKDQLASAANIEWFTNQEIQDGETGLIRHELEHNAFAKLGGLEYDVSHQIRGFKITNKSGMTYHYSLPVYSYNEVSYNESRDYKNVLSYSENIKTHPYAYSWLLTAITGPDFIDRGAGNGNPNGVIDDSDWGYWVKFDYGRWTKRYKWRGPDEGGQEDKLTNSLSYSYGVKEMYYMDAIKTRSHTALFVKSMKQDGKSVVSLVEGGFGVEKDGNNVVNTSTASLKLDKIMLFTNENLLEALRDDDESVLSFNNLRSLGTLYDQTVNLNGSNVTIHEGDNVVDTDDLNELPKNITDFTLRVIDFNQDYSVCPQTPNSFELNYANLSSYTEHENGGKLTLKGIETQGVGGVGVMPPMTFEYIKSSTPYSKDFIDNWGYYNSGFVEGEAPSFYNDNYLNSISAEEIDSWNLSSVTTSLGAKINIQYESDRYGKSCFSKESIPLKQILVHKMNKSTTLQTLGFNEELIPNDQPLSSSSKIDLVYLIERTHDNECHEIFNDIEFKPEFNVLHNVDVKINYYGDLEVNDPVLYDQMTSIDYVNSDCVHGNLLAGYILVNKTARQEVLGGGVRVKSIEVESDNRIYKTSYSYSGGVTSYTPTAYRSHPVLSNNPHSDYDEYNEDRKNALIKLEKYMLKENGESIVYANFIPPPGVMYSKVRLTNEVVTKITTNPNDDITTPVPGYTEYEYEVDVSQLFYVDRGEESILEASVNQEGNETTTSIHKGRIWKILDFTSQLGALKSVKTYGAADKLLYETKTTYLSEGVAIQQYKEKVQQNFKGQGLFDQLFYESRETEEFEQQFVFRRRNLNQVSVATKWERYPAIPIKQETFDYRKGLQSETRTVGFDFYSGDATHMVTKDINGNRMMSEVIPAYRKYEGMGLNLSGLPHKNMLSQPAETYSWQVSATSSTPFSISDYTKTGFVSGSKTIWSPSVATLSNGEAVPDYTVNNVWRAKENYVATYFSNRTYKKAADILPETVPTLEQDNPVNGNKFWEKVSELNYVDVYSHPLQVSDINGLSSVALYDPSMKYQIASFGAAKKNEVAYCGVEYARQNEQEGNVLIVGEISARNPHTGKYAAKAQTGQKALSYTFTPAIGKAYFASAWVYVANDNGDLSNVQLACSMGSSSVSASRLANDRAGSYYLLQLTIPAQAVAQEVEVYCQNINSPSSAYFDDFRVHPLEGSAGAYVYDKNTGLLTHVLNNDNFFSRFEYTPIGQLKALYTEVFDPIQREKIVSQQEYNYGGNN